MKHIIFCGGGSGGHVVPGQTLMRAIRASHPEASVYAIGSENGIEAKVFRGEKVPFKGIATGKLRRYFSLENFTDLFRITLGVFQSYFFLLKFKRKESIIFSTGGFVSVPVVVAAWLQGKKIFIHEQTSRVGLANKICSIFADKVMITFEGSVEHFPKEKTHLIGYPLRKEILTPPDLTKVGDLDLTKNQKPVLFLTGGGNGSLLLNNLLLEIKENLEKDFFIIHQCGKKFLDELKVLESDSYKVFDFIGEEMVSLLAHADVVISRSGAGTVVELMSLGKPSIFIPLKIAQKNEQYWNAIEAQEKVGSIVLKEDEATGETLIQAIKEIQKKSPVNPVLKNPTEDIVREMFNA
ncbi:MAG: UDP-N-acetylglucosamine--N-acetylmuramyl-(pentapeptide) pyrophosphoryl-undecaprenol N-acetylglucosamine transferase [Halobacteriovoraceae bacterium]|nr:UDP-N-acetylglucosamine--N-acetylmuramyl-(pentapeptide) pyrophosphoryl-undecaprenol N-acetylglucosamine transferase [Halobacteriovoraceae bacterium]